ncbi:hypothetical protein AAVH_42983, partial [Aphelenchoides avenae]
LSGKVVDTAVCFNTTTGQEERCCCYGDGCNENTRRGEFLAKGITVKSPTTCIGFDGFSNGKIVYSEKATGPAEFSEYEYFGEEQLAYPNGTVARLVCDKGYAAYWSTYVYDKDIDIYEKRVPTYTCNNRRWVEDGENRTEPSSNLGCLRESQNDWHLAEPPTQTEEDDDPLKLTLADSVAQRIELFYDKAKHSEQVFLKRLFKNIATKIDT